MPALKNVNWEKFAQALAQGDPQAEAYRKAFGKENRAQASRLSSRDEIRTRVADLVHRERIIEHRAEEKAVQRAVERVAVTRERVLEEQARIAFMDPGDVLEWRGTKVILKDSASLTPAMRAAISGVRKTKDGVAITFHSKASALDALGKTLGIGSDKGSAAGNVPPTAETLSDREVARRLAFLLAKGAAQAKGD